jgi:hypothetical protein
MKILPISPESVYQSCPRDNSLSRDVQSCPGSVPQGDDSVHIGQGVDRTPVYDRTGSVPGPDRTDQEKNAPAEGNGTEELSDEERRQVQQLEQRDQKVRAHEMAHMAAGGGLIRGGVKYQYQKGPDGKIYAVGGEVSIDTSSEGNPEQTIQKMQRVRAAALAPADPSAQDRAVAAAAAQKAQHARAEAAQERMSEMQAAFEQQGLGEDEAQGPDGDKSQEPAPETAGSNRRFSAVA